MPVTTTYPGIYIQELPSNTHTIAAAPTSVTVFVGYTHPFRTPSANFGQALEIFSFSDYERLFGGFYQSAIIDANVSYAVNAFFTNGGTDAFVVGLNPAHVYGRSTVGGSTPDFVFDQTSTAGIGFVSLQPVDSPLATLKIVLTATSSDTATVAISYGTMPTENFTVSLNSTDPDFIGAATDSINGVSKLVTVQASPAYPTSFTSATYTETQSLPTPITAGSTLIAGGTGPTVGITITALQPTDAVPLSVIVNNVQADTTKALTIADLVVTYGGQTETYRKISLVPSTKANPNPNFIESRINGVSSLISVSPNTAYPAAFSATSFSASQAIQTVLPPGAISVFSAADFLGVFQEDSSLDKVPIFNLLLTPGIINNAVLSEALAFAERKLAFFIMDPPPDDTADSSNGSANLIAGFVNGGDNEGNVAPLSPNGALYFPYLLADNPVTGLSTTAAGNPFTLPPSGYVAGIYAATDSSRGVWKAPAGIATTLLDTLGVVPGGVMTDSRQGVLNPIGVNCIRTFPGTGTVVFGARTLVTANQAYQQWWYVPVRRMALFLEQTLKTNLTWVIFEPNDTPLWTAIRISIQGFMLSLYNQGAFAGATPSDAFQVKCDSTTTTPTDQANGTVNIIVAFAPLRPAEFVVVKISQLAGQASS